MISQLNQEISHWNPKWYYFLAINTIVKWCLICQSNFIFWILSFQIETFIKGFKLSSLAYKRVMHLLTEEMNQGLSSKSHYKADIKMFPTFVRALPDGTGELSVCLSHGSKSHYKANIKMFPTFVCALPDGTGSLNCLSVVGHKCVCPYVTQHQFSLQVRHQNFISTRWFRSIVCLNIPQSSKQIPL